MLPSHQPVAHCAQVSHERYSNQSARHAHPDCWHISRRTRSSSVLMVPLPVLHRTAHNRTQAARPITLRKDIHNNHSRWHHLPAPTLLVRPMGR